MALPPAAGGNTTLSSSFWPSSNFAELDRDAMPESTKWNTASSNALQHAAAGFITAGAASMILARSSTARIGIVAAGAGFGIGRAYVDMRYLFNHDVPANRGWIASVVPKTVPPPASA